MIWISGSIMSTSLDLGMDDMDLDLHPRPRAAAVKHIVIDSISCSTHAVAAVACMHPGHIVGLLSGLMGLHKPTSPEAQGHHLLQFSSPRHAINSAVTDTVIPDECVM